MPEPLATVRIPVRWGDQDALGHVNNATFFRYVEQARIEWLAGVPDAPWTGGAEAAQGPLVVHLAMDFRAPVVYPATVEVDVLAGRVGRTSLGLDHELRVGGEVVATAQSVLVWADYAAGRPVPVPDGLREILSA